MIQLASKILSLLIALGYILAVQIANGQFDPQLLIIAGYLLLPLTLIWFPEELGSFTGYVGRGGFIDTETPPVFVSLFGWFLLVGFPLLTWWFARR